MFSSASPSTRSGASRAISSATRPPIEWPANANRSGSTDRARARPCRGSNGSVGTTGSSPRRPPPCALGHRRPGRLIAEQARQLGPARLPPAARGQRPPAQHLMAALAEHAVEQHELIGGPGDRLDMLQRRCALVPKQGYVRLERRRTSLGHGAQDQRLVQRGLEHLDADHALFPQEYQRPWVARPALNMVQAHLKGRRPRRRRRWRWPFPRQPGSAVLGSG